MKRLTINLKPNSPRDQIISDYVEKQTQFTGESVSTIINALLFEGITRQQSGQIMPAQQPWYPNTEINQTHEVGDDDPENMLGAL